MIEYVPVIERAVTSFDLNLDENSDFKGKHFSQHRISSSIKSHSDKFGIENKSLKDQINFLLRELAELEYDIKKLNRHLNELQSKETTILAKIDEKIKQKLSETYTNGVEKQKQKDFAKNSEKTKIEIIKENKHKKNSYISDLIDKEKHKADVKKKLSEVQKAEKTLQQ